MVTVTCAFFCTYACNVFLAKITIKFNYLSNKLLLIVQFVFLPGWNRANVGGREESTRRPLADHSVQTTAQIRPGPFLVGDGMHVLSHCLSLYLELNFIAHV